MTGRAVAGRGIADGVVLRLVEMGTEDSASGTDVMEISRPRDLRNIADLLKKLGIPIPKQLLLGSVQNVGR